MTPKYRILFLIFLLTGTALAGPAPAAVKTEPLRVFVSILPVEYFVEQVGRDRVTVETLVQPGHSPATYAPTPKQMASLAQAQVYFRIGVPFENTLIPKLNRSIPDLKIVDLREGIDMLPLDADHTEHGEAEGDLDPHTWLDPVLALHQALLIRDTLIAQDPDGEKQYRANFALLETELRELDTFLRQSLLPLAGQPMYVFHPAYGYFCRAYNLRQKAINPDAKGPGARHLARLMEEAQKDRVRVIFVQPQFSLKAARAIARSIGSSVAPLDPLARNYPANMRYIAQQLLTSLSGDTNSAQREIK